jgi:SAM-dependent methyltransferase
MTPEPLKTDSLHDWLLTPAGQYALAWEQMQCDRAVADVFGFHALQLGMPSLNALQNNRIPYRWLGCDRLPTVNTLGSGVLLTASHALPLADGSLDLVVLPHTLELSSDPHATLREVERVLVPEGRLVILGFNPTSLWGIKPRWHQGAQDLGQPIGQWRLRDWLKLLSFEVASNQLGCYRPAFRSERWLQRMAWMDTAGARWWPILGAAYCMVAIKRVRGMRLMGPAWKRSAARQARAVTTASKGME